MGLVLAAALVTSAPLFAAEDEGDAAYVHPLVNQALETEKTGVEIPWANPETGKRGVIVVERTFYRDQQPCRDYRRTVEEPGSAPAVIEGTGCRVGPGRWELEEEPAAEASGGKPGAIDTAAGPKPQPADPAAQPANEPAPGTKAAAEAEAGAENGCADPADMASIAEEAAPPEPTHFPSYTMPSPASL